MTLKACNQEEIKYIEGYRTKFNQIVSAFLQQQKNSAWMISCCTHGYASNKYYDDKNEKVPENTGKTVKEAIDEFTFEGKRILSVDLVPWPLNKPCAF